MSLSWAAKFSGVSTYFTYLGTVHSSNPPTWEFFGPLSIVNCNFQLSSFSQHPPHPHLTLAFLSHPPSQLDASHTLFSSPFLSITYYPEILSLAEHLSMLRKASRI